MFLMHHFLVIWSPTNLHNHCLIHYFFQLFPCMDSSTHFMSFNLHHSICPLIWWLLCHPITLWALISTVDMSLDPTASASLDHFMHFKSPPLIYLAWSDGCCFTWLPTSLADLHRWSALPDTKAIVQSRADYCTYVIYLRARDKSGFLVLHVAQ